MTNRKIFLIVVGVIASLLALIVIFSLGIFGSIFYSVSTSQAAETARSFLRNNEKLKADIGEVKDFGSIVKGGVAVSSGNEPVTIRMKVIGANATVEASVNLVFVRGSDWRVVSASYVNKAGQTISLQDPYDSKLKMISRPVLQPS
ncbi:MAG TPA: hypothetical protein VI306_12950 [Pyrinomonadaceae bacterium]